MESRLAALALASAVPLLLWGCGSGGGGGGGGGNGPSCDGYGRGGSLAFPPRCHTGNCGGFREFKVGVVCKGTSLFNEESPRSMQYCAQRCAEFKDCSHFYYTTDHTGTVGYCRGCSSAPNNWAECADAYKMDG
mmetsp:Transcript_100989/g.281317  ORF Transcript_100989/g.281317 Transcript_100989/m.281317 type:complete len:134 (-) Transcript_100989:112-513(-)